MPCRLSATCNTIGCCAGQLSSANSASVPSRMHSMVSSSSFLGLPSSLSMSRASSQALPPNTSTHPSQPQPSASKWRSLAWRTSSRSLASSASISSSPSSPSLPNLPPDALTRKPFVLRMVSLPPALLPCLTVCHRSCAYLPTIGM